MLHNVVVERVLFGRLRENLGGGEIVEQGDHRDRIGDHVIDFCHVAIGPGIHPEGDEIDQKQQAEERRDNANLALPTLVIGAREAGGDLDDGKAQQQAVKGEHETEGFAHSILPNIKPSWTITAAPTSGRRVRMRRTTWPKLGCNRREDRGADRKRGRRMGAAEA